LDILVCYFNPKILVLLRNQSTILIHIGWVPPLAGWVCLNIDGACKDGVIGCGGVIRGSEGNRFMDSAKLLKEGRFIWLNFGVF
jgi:hypothetical protein